MKNITKIKHWLYLSVLVAGLAFFAGCTDDFEELNTSKTELASLGEDEIPFLFSKAQSSSSYAFWRYQVAQNLFSDLYAQYFATTATYFPSDRNVIRMDWLQWHWRPIYAEVIPQLLTIFEETEPTSPEHALAQIMWVYSFHRLTDYYGPVPYFQAGQPLPSVPYDSQEDIYMDMMEKLKQAESTLKSNASATPYGSFDLMYSGDVSKWIKFANSLKLRLAMRMSNANPSLAKTLAEEAVTGGVMTTVDDDALMYKTEQGDDVNGLGGIAVWNEFRMSAAMESALKGYEDPRLQVYFQPNNDGEFNGLRNGLNTEELGDAMNSANANSNVGARWVSRSGGGWSRVGDAPQNIMHAAEVYFLRAEGALKGWSMGGTAQELYEMGIATSMNQWGITDEAAITAYIASENTPIAPADFMESPAVSDAPIKWSEDADVQKEQIALQKWLALYPDGMEAFADMRRADLPALYPVANSDNASLPNGERPKRIPFLDYEKNTNGAAVSEAVKLLNGPDEVTTPLWWDK